LLAPVPRELRGRPETRDYPEILAAQAIPDYRDSQVSTVPLVPLVPQALRARKGPKESRDLPDRLEPPERPALLSRWR
jgi:hypothetical protein